LDVSTNAGKYASRIVLASEAISERAGKFTIIFQLQILTLVFSVNILRKEGWIVYIVRLPTSVSEVVDVGKSGLLRRVCSASIKALTTVEQQNQPL